MAYPDNFSDFREIENLPGIVYDADNKRCFYVEDLVAAWVAIQLIEQTLGLQPQGEFDTVGERLDAASYQKITVSDTAPATPNVGDLWVDTN